MTKPETPSKRGRAPRPVKKADVGIVGLGVGEPSNVRYETLPGSFVRLAKETGQPQVSGGKQSITDVLKPAKLPDEEGRRPSKLLSLVRKAGVALLAVLIPFVLACGIFVVRTGRIPAFSKAGRTSQVIASYLSSREPVVIRSARLRHHETSCFFAFQRDPYLASVFGLKDDFAKVSTNEDRPYDNRVIVLEPIDVGIFTPIVEFVWPLVKTYDIGIRSAIHYDEDDSVFGIPRIWDAVATDLDGDGQDELVVYWMNYGGGSAAAVFPLVLSFSGQAELSTETFPFLDKKEGKPEFILTSPRDYMFLVNGKETTYPCIRYNTDCFWDFRDINGDSKMELTVAFPQDDWDYHYGKQSWLVAVFSYAGKRFVPVSDCGPFCVPKSAGLGLPEIQGYSFVPAMGQISYMWMPSWMELSSQCEGLPKARSESAVWRLLEGERKKKKPRH